MLGVSLPLPVDLIWSTRVRTDTDAPYLDVRLPAATLLYENARTAGGGFLFAASGWALAYPLLPSVWGFRTALAMTIIAVVGVAADLRLNDFQQRNFTLRVLPRGVEMKRGRYIATSMSIIPGAVLSVDVHVGPVLRRLGLARLRLNGIAQLPEIPPLAEADARAVQRLMIEQLGMDMSSPGDVGTS